MKRAVLVDLSGLWRANWHATQDMDLGEAYTRTLAGVQRAIAGYGYSAICIDMPPYKRKQLLPEYKGQREAPSPQMVEQFSRLRVRLEQDGMLLWGAQGYEADDIIATAVAHARGEELAITVSSSDKDLMCLVNDVDSVTQYSPASQATFNEAAVVEKFGVPPVLIPELLALMGDASDNIPGVPGVGPVTAAKLLKQFGSLENVLELAPTIKQDKLRAAIVANTDAVRLGRKVIELDTSAPIKFMDLFARREPKPLTHEASGFEESDVEEAPKEEPKSEPVHAVDLGRKAASAPSGREVSPDAVTVEQARALAIIPPKEWALQLEPDSTQSAIAMAGALHNSRLFTQYGNAQAIFAVILRGRSLGIDAVTSLASFHVVEGRPTMSAALIVGLVLRSGKAEYFDLVETTDEKATWVTKRVGGSGREVMLTWDVSDAIAAGMMTGTKEAPAAKKPGSNWDKYRRTMLRWRCATELARAVYPDVCVGLLATEEME